MQWLCNASIGALTGAGMQDDIFAIVKHCTAYWHAWAEPGQAGKNELN